MKSRFNWQYRLTKEEVKALFDDCQIFIDTNILLNVFQVDKDFAKKIVATLARYKERMCITHHVMEEYHRNLIDMLTDRMVAAQKQLEALQWERFYERVFDQQFRSFLTKEQQNKFREQSDRARKRMLEEVSALKNEYEEAYNSMELPSLISNELSVCMLDPLTEEEYAAIDAQWPTRRDNQVPPGYKDKGKSTNASGDYVIWEEILKWATEHQKNVVLISNEKKPDWVWEEHGFVIGPRKELRKEFQERTGGKYFHMISLQRLMEMSDNQLSEQEKEALQRTTNDNGNTRTLSDIIEQWSHLSKEYDAMFSGLDWVGQLHKRMNPMEGILPSFGSIGFDGIEIFNPKLFAGKTNNDESSEKEKLTGTIETPDKSSEPSTNIQQ